MTGAGTPAVEEGDCSGLRGSLHRQLQIQAAAKLARLAAGREGSMSPRRFMARGKRIGKVSNLKPELELSWRVDCLRLHGLMLTLSCMPGNELSLVCLSPAPRGVPSPL